MKPNVHSKLVLLVEFAALLSASQLSSPTSKFTKVARNTGIPGGIPSRVNRIYVIIIAMFIALMLTGCPGSCPPPTDRIITGIEVHPIERTIVGNKIYDDYSDRLTHWIRFDVITEFENVEATSEYSGSMFLAGMAGNIVNDGQPIEISLASGELSPQMSSCYPGEILNRTVTNKSRFYFDKPIKFKGRTVTANTNLLEFQEFDGSTYNVSMPDLGGGIGSVGINRDFELSPDTYFAHFEWSTIEGQIFSDTVKVYIDVDLP